MSTHRLTREAPEGQGLPTPNSRHPPPVYEAQEAVPITSALNTVFKAIFQNSQYPAPHKSPELGLLNPLSPAPNMNPTLTKITLWKVQLRVAELIKVCRGFCPETVTCNTPQNSDRTSEQHQEWSLHSQRDSTEVQKSPPVVLASTLRPQTLTLNLSLCICQCPGAFAHAFPTASAKLARCPSGRGPQVPPRQASSDPILGPQGYNLSCSCYVPNT